MNRMLPWMADKKHFGLILIVFYAIFLCSIGNTSEGMSGTQTMFVANFSKPVKNNRLQSTNAFPTHSVRSLHNGAIIQLTEKIADQPVKFYMSPRKIWVIMSLRKTLERRPLMQNLLEAFAEKYGLPRLQSGKFVNKVSIPVHKQDGTIDMAGMRLPKAMVADFFEWVPREIVSKKWGVSPQQLKLTFDRHAVYWYFEKNGKRYQERALLYNDHKNGSQKSSPYSGLIPFLLFLLPFNEIRLSRKEAVKYLGALFLATSILMLPVLAHAGELKTSVVYQNGLSGWDNVLDRVQTKYPNSQIIAFNSQVSEKLAALQDFLPDQVIVIVEPLLLTPSFIDDLDNSMTELDADGFHDAIGTIISGFTASDALALLNADHPTDDHSLILANPDGTLLESGYAGNYLTQILTDDDTYRGDESYYINVTSGNNDHCTALNLQDELNNDYKDCVFFLDHGNSSLWGLREGHLLTGVGSQLRAYNGTYYDIHHPRNTFVDAEACLTLRIQGNRASQWKPWENLSTNFTASAGNSIALAWMAASPGYYIGNTSVSYGLNHLMLVLQNMLKFGYSPARALTICKNVYQLIIDQDETSESNLADGATKDFLQYASRELAGIGDPNWTVAITGSAVNYGISYSSSSQQDVLPTNSRGLIYVEQAPKWRCTTTLTVNSEIVTDDTKDQVESPFTFIPVEDVGADTTTGTISYSDQCAVIGGIFKPTTDTRQMAFVGGNPSDTDKLYSHNWYGKGSSNAVETFKCALNSNEMVWVLAAGITDADSDDEFEWRINNGTQKAFSVYYWVTPIQQQLSKRIVVDGDTRQIPMTLSNSGTQTISEVIAKVPVPTNAHALKVTPAANIHDVVVVTEDDDTYAEFTVNSVAAGTDLNFVLQYDIQKQSATQRNLIAGIPYPFVVNEDTLAMITFSQLGTLDSVQITAFLDSFPDAIPGSPNQLPVKRYFKINGFGGTGFSANVWLYYQQAEFDSSDVSDESSLYAARWNELSWEPYPGTSEPGRNRVNFTTDKFSIWGIGGSNGGLPVELSTFTVEWIDNQIRLQWRTETETRNMGFEIFRRSGPTASWTYVASFKEYPELRGSGTSMRPRRYAFRDVDVAAGKTYWYKLIDVDFAGLKTEHQPVSIQVPAAKLPSESQLMQNYPNPFNATTVIQFSVKPVIAGNLATQPVQVTIYDISGREVIRLVEQEYAPGQYAVKWHGRDAAEKPVAAGTYFYRLKVGDFVALKKLVLLY